MGSLTKKGGEIIASYSSIESFGGQSESNHFEFNEKAREEKLTHETHTKQN
jgi:hypothetical protein